MPQRNSTRLGMDHDRIRSALLAVWANAWLSGRASYDETVARVTRDDEPHRVCGLPGADDVPLGWALTALRERSAAGVRLVLPVAGDPRGLPAGTPFATAAMAAGEAAVGGGLGLVPAVTAHGSALGSSAVLVSWQAHEVEETPPDPLSVSEAEHELADTVRDTASELAALDVASWRPAIAEAVTALRDSAGAADLPRGHDPQAVRLIAQAERLGGVLDLAADDAPGGSVTGAEAARRAELLRPLATAVRRARLAGYNAEASRRI